MQVDRFHAEVRRQAPNAVAAGDLPVLEQSRRAAAHDYLGHRFNYLWFARRQRIPSDSLRLSQRCATGSEQLAARESS